ncbi:hypothetical protein GLOTRDRAFT_126843 [Gloeophyllum trabeum ATCC 11539]|uniref:Uncharacterized protein n=1 Tax=Gloeophyllum trabeum (strain ATCC 11539 / FP-39264 / Madison 617) TaxID=670483 RepID=S7RUE0_GLOTA|nr:uncharacterized protein GLOTRDRAFT_126843 [Gloeophyllum trabeum ATCC 11539]EPQ58350.1 hypothetical protein GLOTRDRAFT_126843 [Gloeophyllum trabeum ATCC 11539]
MSTNDSPLSPSRRSSPSSTPAARRKKKTQSKKTRPDTVLRKGKYFNHVQNADELDQDHKHTTTEAKDMKPTSAGKTAKSTGKSGNDGSKKEVSNVPAPIPDTGFQGAALHTLTVSNSVSSTAPVNTDVVQAAVPATAGLASTLLATATSSVLLASTAVTTPESSAAAAHEDTSKHIRTIIIVLVALGSAFASVGLCIILRACRRPKRRNLPTPSLPILQDAYPDQQSPEESPIFGGKERLSDNVEHRWTWTQYSQGEGTLSEKPGSLGNVSGPYQNLRLDAPASKVRPQSKTLEMLATFPTPPQTNQRPLSVGNREGSGKRTMSRLSMMSYSSPRIGCDTTAPQHIGLALDTTTVGSPTNGQPTQIGEDVAAKRVSLRSARRLSARQSVHGLDKGKGNTRDTCASLYGGADVTSPIADKYIPPVPTMDSPSPALARGRERIKAPYPSTSLRTSASASSFVSNINPFEDVRRIPVPPIPVLEKSEARRARDTKAITAVLGLTSPPSPEMTIYPDDSLSVVGDKLYAHPMPTRKINADNMHAVTPPMEPSTSLGNLMLNGFGTPAQSRSFEELEESSSEMVARTEEQFKYSGNSKRADDKPPRVPSPPLMPSLAQMAMQHANPEDYASYSCPTYSIYGYYTEEERKSRFGPGDFRVSTFR